MSKTYLVNLTESELKALACQYLEKGCASESHYIATAKARVKLLHTIEKISNTKSSTTEVNQGR